MKLLKNFLNHSLIDIKIIWKNCLKIASFSSTIYIYFIINQSKTFVLVTANIANKAALFWITDAKLFVPVVTLSVWDNERLLE